MALDNKFYEEAVISEWDALANECFHNIRMDSVTQKLLSLKKRNIATKYTAENLWEGFLNREPYNTFFKAFQNGDEYLMAEILRNYKSHNSIQLISPLRCFKKFCITPTGEQHPISRMFILSFRNLLRSK